MPPFGNAVCLINRIERYLYLLEQGYILLFCQGLRGYIEKFGRAGQQISTNLGNLRLSERGVQKMRHSLIPGDEPANHVHLVLHQGNQWGYDYRRALHQKGWKLIAKAFPASGRHEDKCIVALDEMAYYLLLPRLERRIAEEQFEFPEKFFRINHTI